MVCCRSNQSLTQRFVSHSSTPYNPWHISLEALPQLCPLRQLMDGQARSLPCPTVTLPAFSEISIIARSDDPQGIVEMPFLIPCLMTQLKQLPSWLDIEGPKTIVANDTLPTQCPACSHSHLCVFFAGPPPKQGWSNMQENSSLPPALNAAVVEPHPEWDVARAQWKWAWPLHVYGLGALFLLLTTYALVMLLHLHRRLRHHPLTAHITLAVLFLSSSKAFMLFVDPYSSVHLLPMPLVQLLHGLTYPCLIAIFTLLELSIMRITRVRLGSDHSQQVRLLSWLLLGHFGLVGGIYITVALHTDLKLMILLSQSIFITWGLVLCFIFVYNGFKITQFTNETSRVLQQIAVYTRVKKELSKVGNHRDLALHRIRKARVRRNSADTNQCSEVSEESGAESSDSLCFFNEAHFELDETQLEAVFKKQRINRCKKTTKRAQANGSAKTIQPESSAESYITDSTASIAGVVSLEDQLLSQLQNRCLRDTLHTIGAARDGYHALSTPSAVFTNEHALRNNQTTPDHLQQTKEPLPTTKGDDDDDADADDEDDEDNKCSGYMADTEHNSPKMKAKTKHKFHIQERNNREDPPEPENRSPGHSPYPLPHRDNALGLYRLRQGRVLRKVLKLTYACTLFAFVCCVLQLYAMFGVYGVLSNETVAQPWPWLTFMTFSRSVAPLYILLAAGLCNSFQWLLSGLAIFLVTKS